MHAQVFHFIFSGVDQHCPFALSDRFRCIVDLICVDLFWFILILHFFAKSTILLVVALCFIEAISEKLNKILLVSMSLRRQETRKRKEGRTTLRWTVWRRIVMERNVYSCLRIVSNVGLDIGGINGLCCMYFEQAYISWKIRAVFGSRQVHVYVPTIYAYVMKRPSYVQDIKFPSDFATVFRNVTMSNIETGKEI
jgi:hypothetical protein